MPINADKPHLWKTDVAKSVDFYNAWFLAFAPDAYRKTRLLVTRSVADALVSTKNLRDISPEMLRNNPSVLPMLRMATAPPIARDQLTGLAKLPTGLVKTMEEEQRLPSRMSFDTLNSALERIGQVILLMADEDIFPWLQFQQDPTETELFRASTIVADRLCGMNTNPIIRNEQEKRQLASIRVWLEARGYFHTEIGKRARFDQMKSGTFAFRLNVIGNGEGGGNINIPIDTVIMPLSATEGELPLFIEAKSAGDFTNTNKRRKEEAVKITQLKRAHGKNVRFILFLCGYFDTPYLGYEAAEGIDWVWEHRIDDLSAFGI